MFLTSSLILHRSCQLLEMRWQLYRTYTFFCRVLHNAYLYFKTMLIEREVSGSASSRQKLKPICATRWIERHDPLIIFVTLLPAVVSTLEELQQENKQVEVATKAATLLNSVHKCTFLIAALVMQHTSGIFLPVSKLLQKKELDIFAVIELIDSVLDILRQNRSNCKNVFHKIFDQAKNECAKYDAPLLIPRRCKSQIFRDNYPSDDTEHFFREAIFVPY